MLPVIGFGLDEIPRGLPGEQSHQIDKARIGPGWNKSNRGSGRRIDDHAKLFGVVPLDRATAASLPCIRD